MGDSSTNTIIIIALLIVIFILFLWPLFAAFTLKKKGKLIIKS